jgi:hypothetical protein
MKEFLMISLKLRRRLRREVARKHNKPIIE